MLLGHLTAVITVFGLCCPAAAGTADEKRQGEELIDATKRGDLTSVESLVQAGVNVNSRNAAGRTPMHLACGDGNLNLCEYLLEVGGDYDAKDIYHRSPLSLAAWHGYTEIVQALLDKGADIHTREKEYGYQPLHYAAKRGWKDIVHMLIEHGADPHSTANTGESVKGSLRGDNEEKKHLEKIIDNAKKSATVRAKQTKRLQDMHSMSVSDLIANHQLTESDAQAYLPALEEMGAEAVADLRWIELDDFESVKLKTVHKNKLWKVIQEVKDAFSSPNPTTIPQSATTDAQKVNRPHAPRSSLFNTRGNRASEL